MANWRRRCSYLLALPAETRRRVPLAATLIALSASACGHAEDQAAENAATPAAPTDPAASRAEQLRGLFDTARQDAANAPLPTQDDAAEEATRNA